MEEHQKILSSIDEDISSFVSDKFADFISQKVKKEVEQKKEQFLNDLNMCQEEYPIYQHSNILTEEIVTMLKNVPQKYQYKLFDTKSPEYDKSYEEVVKYYNTLTEYPQQIIDDNHFLIHLKGSSKQHFHDRRSQINDTFGYGITNKGTIYEGIPKVNPYYLVKEIDNIKGQGKEMKVKEERIYEIMKSKDVENKEYTEIKKKFLITPRVSNQNNHSTKMREVILLPTEKYKTEYERYSHGQSWKWPGDIGTGNTNYHLYDVSKYIKKGIAAGGRRGYWNKGKPCGCIPDSITNERGNTHQPGEPQKVHEGCGCRSGIFAKGIKKTVQSGGKEVNSTEYVLVGSPEEDAVRRCIENDICPDCGAGELLYSVEEIGFDPRVINKYPLNNEYIDILHLIKPNNLEILFGIQTIYAKYHPKANEHYVIEEKLKKLYDIENTIEERVNVKKKELDEKIKFFDYLEEEKKKLEENKTVFEEDKKTLRVMNKHAQEKINKMEKECEKKCNEIEKEHNTNIVEKEQLISEELLNQKKITLTMESNYTEKMKKLLTIAMELNEKNDKLDDVSGASNELFTIIGTINSCIQEHQNNKLFIKKSRTHYKSSEPQVKNSTEKPFNLYFYNKYGKLTLAKYASPINVGEYKDAGGPIGTVWRIEQDNNIIEWQIDKWSCKNTVFDIRINK